MPNVHARCAVRSKHGQRRLRQSISQWRLLSRRCIHERSSCVYGTQRRDLQPERDASRRRCGGGVLLRCGDATARVWRAARDVRSLGDLDQTLEPRGLTGVAAGAEDSYGEPATRCCSLAAQTHMVAACCCTMPLVACGTAQHYSLGSGGRLDPTASAASPGRR